MPCNKTCPLWPRTDESFFSENVFTPRMQFGPHCVSTVLAILTGESPEDFQGDINTQDPVSWSDALKRRGLKLAYCPTDVRKLLHYLDELMSLDDLFLLSYYTTPDPARILGEPDPQGWVCGSHLVILHRQSILDPARGSVTPATDHPCAQRHTKRIFRVVPDTHPRGL